MDVRCATGGDEEALFELHRTAFQAHIERIWGWDEKWQRSNFSREFASSTTSVVQLDGHPIGFVQVRYDPHRVYLLNIALHPDFQRMGIGTRLLQDLKAEASARRVPLELAVFRTNDLAFQFYGRHGFRPIGETKTHIAMSWSDV